MDKLKPPSHVSSSYGRCVRNTYKSISYLRVFILQFTLHSSALALIADLGTVFFDMRTQPLDKLGLLELFTRKDWRCCCLPKSKVVGVKTGGAWNWLHFLLVLRYENTFLKLNESVLLLLLLLLLGQSTCILAIDRSNLNCRAITIIIIR